MRHETLVTDGDDGARVQVSVDALLRVRLAEPVTGYTWQLDQGPRELDLVAVAYERIEGAALGAGGVRDFLFHARRTGTGSLVLALRRAWESGAPERVFSLTVTVT